MTEYIRKYPPKFCKLLKKIGNSKISKHIITKLKLLSTDPYNKIERLKEDRDKFKFRIGSYRVILEINEDEKIICFLWVGLRSDAYKNIKEI